MQDVLLYFLKMTVCSGILFLYYILFLRNKKFHRYNRFYLLSAVLISLVFPLVNINIPWQGEEEQPMIIKTLRVITVEADYVEAVDATEGAASSAFKPWLLGYIAVGLMLLAFVVYAVFRVFQIRKKYPANYLEKIRFYNTAEPDSPFSFFRNIFWNKEMELNSQKGQQVFRHELFHVKQLHSIDIVFIEIVCALGWINPFFHLINKELRMIHEFLADEYAVSHVDDRYAYAELLVMNAMKQRNILPLAHSFFHPPIKRRVTMILNLHHEPRFNYLRRVMALPLFALLFCGVSLKAQQILDNHMNDQIPLTSANSSDAVIRANKTIKVIVDPGHGGTDPGARIPENPSVNEKQIALAVGKIEFAPPKIASNENPANSEDKVLLTQHNYGHDTITDPDNFIRYLVRNIGYPEMAANAWIQGEVYFSVEMGDKGSVRNIKILDVIPADADKLRSVVITSNRPKVKTDVPKGNEGNYLISAAKNAVTKHEKFGKQESGEKFRTMYYSIDFKQNPADPNVKYRVFSDGKIAKQESDWDKIFTKTEIEASYPGGVEAWRRFLQRNMRYPDKAAENNIQGTVVVQFIVDKDGNTSEFTIVNPDERLKDLEEEAIRVLKASGKWKPAIQGGRLVKSYKHQPITFRIGASGSNDKAESGDRTKVDMIFTKVEIEPSYPGGLDAWRKFLRENMIYPSEAAKNNTQGKIVVQFIVDKEGAVSDVQVVESEAPGSELETEAVRLINRSGKWSPGIQNGQIVKAYRQQTIIFKLSN